MPPATEALNAGEPGIAEFASSSGKPMPAEVREVCDRLGIHDLVEIALRLIEKHFQPAEICYEPLHDPEEDNEWLGIRAVVRGSVDDVLRKDRACTKEWIELAPPARMGLVRIVFGIR